MKKVSLLCILVVPLYLLCPPELDDDAMMLAPSNRFNGDGQHGLRLKETLLPEPMVMSLKRLPSSANRTISDSDTDDYLLANDLQDPYGVSKPLTTFVEKPDQTIAGRTLQDQVGIQKVVGWRQAFLNRILPSSLRVNFDPGTLPARTKAVADNWAEVNRLTVVLPEEFKNMFTNSNENIKNLSSQKRLLVKQYRAMVKTLMRLNDRYITGQMTEAFYKEESSKVIVLMKSVVIDMQVVLFMEPILQHMLSALDITQDQLQKIAAANKTLYQHYLGEVTEEVKQAAMARITDIVIIEKIAAVAIEKMQEFLADQIRHNDQMDHLQKLKLFQKQLKSIGQKKSYTLKQVQTIVQALDTVQSYMQLENTYKVRNEEFYTACAEFQYDVVQWIKKNQKALAGLADQVMMQEELSFVGLNTTRFAVMSLLLHDSSMTPDFYQPLISNYWFLRKQAFDYPTKNSLFGDDGKQLSAYVALVLKNAQHLASIRYQVLQQMITQELTQAIGKYRLKKIDAAGLSAVVQLLLKAAGDQKETVAVIKEALKAGAPKVFSHLFGKRKRVLDTLQKLTGHTTSSLDSMESKPSESAPSSSIGSNTGSLSGAGHSDTSAGRSDSGYFSLGSENSDAGSVPGTDGSDRGSISNLDT